MTANANIQGILKLTSPLHCAAPGEYGVNDKGYVHPGKMKGEMPCTSTMHQRILADGLRDSVPYFPGNDLRGRLRRKAAAIVMEALAANKEKVPVELYAGLCSGAANAQPENELTIEEAVRGSRHVYMGVFGGGTRLLRSGYSVQDAVPIVRSTLAAGMVPQGFAGYGVEKCIPAASAPQNDDGETVSQADGWKLTDVRHILRVDDAMRVLRPAELARFVDRAEETIGAYQQAVLAGRQEKADAEENGGADVKKKDIGNLVTVQSIIPGVELYFRLDLSDALTPAQIGLVLLSLEALVNEQALGGWCRTGFGKFDATHFRLTVAGEAVDVFTRAENGEYRLAPALNEYVEAMRAEVVQLTVADLVGFFTPRKKPKEAKVSKKSKAEVE